MIRSAEQRHSRRLAPGLGKGILLAGALVMIVLSALTVEAQEPPADSVRGGLDAIRQDMVELRFEKALTSIETLLGDPRLTPAELIEAHILRAQTNVAFGDLNAAEADYREILRRRPSYRPEASLTPSKALLRFEKIRKEIVGTLTIKLEPPDAVLTVDGEPVQRDLQGALPLTAGIYTLRGDRQGYDPFELTVEVLPDRDQPVTLSLTPNARSVILQTEPEGVEVFLDGVSMGVTVRPSILPGASRQPARLQLENLTLGEHEFELRLPCHRTERRRDILTVDLLDPSAKRYDVVTLRRSLATLVLQGGPDGADVTIDGAPVGRLPLEPQEVCPGSHAIAVSRRGRTLWSDTREFVGAAESRIAIVARPNAVIFAEALPAELHALRDDFNIVLRAVPRGADPSTAAGWARLDLPGDTDLAVAVLPAQRLGAGERWFVYSPILRAVDVRGRIDGEFARPDWKTRVWGVSTVDTAVGGNALVVEIASGGSASAVGLRVGDRIETLDGRPVQRSADVVKAFGEATAARRPALELEWSDAEGKRRKATLPATVTPELSGRSDSISRDAARAAWAVIDALGRDEPAALANLALLFSAYGHPASAVETWSRVRWGARAGIGDGTTQYYLGHALVERGDEVAAIEAYRRAAAAESTAFTDLGPAVGPAARDCLADLGVAR